MRILLTKLKHIGDALLMTPTICAIRARHPDSEIVVVVRTGTEGILEGCPGISRVLTAAAPEEHRRSRWNWIEDLKLILELRKQRFDYAIELSDGDRGRWICALVSAKVRSTNDHVIKLHRLWRRVFRSISAYEWGFRHRAEKDFFTVAHCLDVGETPPALCFERSCAVESWVSRQAGGRPVVFHPATRMREKLWPEERWIALGKAMAVPGGRIVISVGPAAEEIALGDRIAAGIGPQAFSTRGQIGWPELAHLLYAARLFVGVDTAAMHLAAACQCPTVAIFGLTSFVQWRPWKCHHRVLAGLPELHEIRAEAVGADNPINRVSVQDVLTAVEALAMEVCDSNGSVEGVAPISSVPREG
jgi:heptosyltransferase-3